MRDVPAETQSENVPAGRPVQPAQKPNVSGQAAIAWVQGIPPAQPLFVPVINPKPGQVFRGWVVGTVAVAVETHWMGNRHRPHLLDPAQCAGCLAGLGRRYYAYLAVSLEGTPKLAILELTAETVRSHPELVDPGYDSRGRYFVIRRSGAKRNSRQVLVFEKRPPDLDAIPADIDVQLALARLWS